jgi:Raf kinase inhibitor-like YbhB/YbcL family protein
MGLMVAAVLAGCAGGDGGTGSEQPTPGSAIGFAISSPDLGTGHAFPRDDTCDGAGRAPGLRWTAPPAGTRRLTLQVFDVDAPGGIFTHWLVYDMPAGTRELSGALPRGAVEGTNDFGKRGWGAPCPPPGPVHRYVIALSAISAPLDLPAGLRRADLDAGEQSHVTAVAQLVATYRR